MDWTGIKNQGLDISIKWTKFYGKFRNRKKAFKKFTFNAAYTLRHLSGQTLRPATISLYIFLFLGLLICSLEKWESSDSSRSSTSRTKSVWFFLFFPIILSLNFWIPLIKFGQISQHFERNRCALWWNSWRIFSACLCALRPQVPFWAPVVSVSSQLCECKQATSCRLAAAAARAKMDIFSAFRSFSSSRSRSNREHGSVKELDLQNNKLNGLLSPRFTRWGSTKRQSRRRRSQNLSICRENRASISVPSSRASSVFGDSCSDVTKIVTSFRPEDYLDPFQGEMETFLFN